MKEHKARILLVDQEPFCIWLVQTTLEATGYEVFATGAADGMVELVSTWQPDLVILGCRPPDLDGYKLCQQIRESSPVPIIMLSTLVDEDAVVKGLDSGADDFMAQPFCVSELLARIQALLRRVEFAKQGDPWYRLNARELAQDPQDRPEPHPAAPDPAATAQVSRRSILKRGVGALGVIAALEVGGASLLFIQSRAEAGRSGRVVEAGRVNSFPLGSVTEFPDAGFFLIRAHNGGFLAVHRRCPHLGCTVDWKPGYERFFCPCHGANFDFYGNFEGPPVPRSLDIFAVLIGDGKVRVDTARLGTRERFSPEDP
jgi:cytochrome b6-f complex iron-sulfur subunit